MAAAPAPAFLSLGGSGGKSGSTAAASLQRSLSRSSSGRLYSSSAPPQGTEPPTEPPEPPSSSSAQAQAPTALEVRDVPGSYGPPLLGVAKDRLNYFFLQGKDEFFRSLMRRYGTTVVRLNMPPGPPFFPDSRTIMCLDTKSVRTLFDSAKVEKRDTFAGTYAPSTGFTGGYRVLPYLDTTEPKHAPLKNFCFYVLQSNGPKWVPGFGSAFGEAAAQWEEQLAKDGSAKFAEVCQQFTFNFLVRAVLGADPAAAESAGVKPALAGKGPSYVQAWTGAQLAPQVSLGLPWPIEEFLHLVPLPPFLVSSQYNKVYEFFAAHGKDDVLEAAAQRFGLDKEEACHNLLFYICFNTWGGIQILFPSIVQRIAEAGLGLQKELAAEVRAAVELSGPDGRPDRDRSSDQQFITMAALQKMELVHATVYETLRTDPPVPFQYGRARSDLLVESHDAAFRVKKGELLASYQGIAMRDPKVFSSPDSFQPHRFLGPHGKKLLESLTWSNGAETQQPSTENKQCPGKDFVSLVARLFVANLFLRYDYFKLQQASSSSSSSGTTATPIAFTALKKRKPAA